MRAPCFAGLGAVVVLCAALAAGQDSLERDPATLPLAAEGRWSEWGPKDRVPAELIPRLRAGSQAYARKDYGGAIAEFSAMLDAEPDYPPALYQLATTYFRLRRYGDCIKVLERFLRVAPGEVGATRAMGHSLYSLGDYQAARTHYERVLAQAPESYEALRGYALCHVRLGDLEGALELLQRVVELRETHADAHTWIASVLYDLERPEEALRATERARELAPFEPRAWFLASQVLLDLERDEEAALVRARFERLSRITQELRTEEGVLLHDPLDGRAWLRSLELLRELGDEGRAVMTSHEIVGRFARESAAPDVEGALRALFLAYVTLRDRPRAEAVRRRIPDGPDKPPAFGGR